MCRCAVDDHLNIERELEEMRLLIFAFKYDEYPLTKSSNVNAKSRLSHTSSRSLLRHFPPMLTLAPHPSPSPHSSALPISPPPISPHLSNTLPLTAPPCYPYHPPSPLPISQTPSPSQCACGDGMSPPRPPHPPPRAPARQPRRPCTADGVKLREESLYTIYYLYL